MKETFWETQGKPISENGEKSYLEKKGSREKLLIKGIWGIVGVLKEMRMELFLTDMGVNLLVT